MTRVVIVGASGYTGMELVEILLRHPHASIVGLFGSERREGGQAFADVCPRFRGLVDLAIQPADPDRIALLRPDAVFLALPHEASVQYAAMLRKHGIKVFDLSGGLRLTDPLVYERYYHFTHPYPALLNEAVYGLVELNRELISSADLVAVPGCYPTSAILPLAPLVQAGALRAGSRPIVDSISGVSGAGRAAKAHTSFCEVSVSAYGVLNHRHGPEIDEHARTRVVFTPHLAPIDRGILTTIHVRLADGWSGAAARETLEAAYGDELFVRILPEGQWPNVALARGTNFCDIGLAADDAASHLVIVSAIDNLIKGAAGQAVQCMNVRLGLPEAAALLPDSAQVVRA